MIKIHLKNVEGINEETSRFVILAKGSDFSFENSLKAVAEWEAKYKRPFLTEEKKSQAEWFDYFCMCAIGDRPDPLIFATGDNNEAIVELSKLIEDVPSATTISDDDSNNSSEIPTSETIYAMMAMAGMDYSCENWNINRLIMTLRVIAEKNKPEKKMSKRDVLLSNAEINERRRKMLGSKG